MNSRGVSKSPFGLRRLVEASSANAKGADMTDLAVISSILAHDRVAEQFTDAGPPARGEPVAAPGTGPDPRRWSALALLCTAFFMVILDSAIVVVALPSIDADLAFGAEDLQWVLSAYLLSFGGLLLLGGRAADLLGRRRMFMVGTGLFALASLAAGLAGTSGALLTARAVQGVAAAIMTPTALSIVMTTFPEGPERNKALGVWGSTGAIGGTAAWLVGGPITDGLGWEWIFFLNVPVAAAVAALSPVLLRESRGVTGRRRFDAAGAVTITAALVALVYAVVDAPQAGWADGQTVGLLTLAAVLIAVFAGIESRSTAPLAPLRVFRSRSLVGGNLVLFALGTMGFAVPFVLTQYAQEVLGWSPIQFGLASLVMPVTAVVGTVSAQRLATRVGVRPVAVVALALTGLGSLFLTRVSVDGSYLGDLFPGLLLLGPGIGAAYVAGSIASLSGVADADAGLASGLNNAAFQIGGAVGVAILSTIAVSGARGATDPAALTRGYGSAFAVAIAVAAVGMAAATLLLGARRDPEPVTPAELATT
jgi:EmrB/QacA subfamily drug resistance transporter